MKSDPFERFLNTLRAKQEFAAWEVRCAQSRKEWNARGAKALADWNARQSVRPAYGDDTDFAYACAALGEFLQANMF